MNAVLQEPETRSQRDAVHAALMHHRGGRHGNDELMARMLASQAVGDGALPLHLGFDMAAYLDLFDYHFPHAHLPEVAPGRPRYADDGRDEEWQELNKLMLMHRAGDDVSEQWMAHIVATACMAGDHLWQDLGLWSRKDLSQLMNTNFPALAARNDRDMKWKKFLYKQLCVQEGIYTCRSPSCEVCPDYAACFAAED